jgi:preprotein translocase subunit SecE
LRHLAEGQLLVIDGDPASDDATIELADPSLVTAWPALQAWIKAHRQAEPLRRQLEADAADWSQRTARGDADIELLDKAQLGELGAWLTDDTRRDLGVSATAESFLAASRAAARKQWWPGKTTMSTALVLVMMLLILATPIILLLIVVLTASVIHKFL